MANDFASIIIFKHLNICNLLDESMVVKAGNREPESRPVISTPAGGGWDWDGG
jgi:hypothetical protein